MLNFQKAASDKTCLGYDHSFSLCSTSNALNKVIFISLDNNDNSKETELKIENMSEGKLDKGKSILGAPLKVIKKAIKQNNHRFTSKKS